MSCTQTGCADHLYRAEHLEDLASDPTLESCCQRDLQDQALAARLTSQLALHDRSSARLHVAQSVVAAGGDALARLEQETNLEDEELGANRPVFGWGLPATAEETAHLQRCRWCGSPATLSPAAGPAVAAIRRRRVAELSRQREHKAALQAASRGSVKTVPASRLMVSELQAVYSLPTTLATGQGGEECRQPPP
jgi:hypothetical protein